MRLGRLCTHIPRLLSAPPPPPHAQSWEVAGYWSSAYFILLTMVMSLFMVQLVTGVVSALLPRCLRSAPDLTVYSQCLTSQFTLSA